MDHHTLSFAILNDLCPMVTCESYPGGPVVLTKPRGDGETMGNIAVQETRFYGAPTAQTLRPLVEGITNKLCVRLSRRSVCYPDPSHFFDEEFFGPKHGEYLDMIAGELAGDGFFRRCRLNKYYCVVMTIDRKRFRVWSKDCEEEIIDWDSILID